MVETSAEAAGSPAIETAWVKPPQEIGGLDHLGVQAPGIEIYGQLLPGITNVTDRARYYSFYPWLFWQFEQRGWQHHDQWQPMLRRADCLFGLIAFRHGVVSADSSDDHGAAVVGSNTLSAVVRELTEGTVVTLSDYAHGDSDRAGRYFKNLHGGLGQYYFGVLSLLGLLTGDSASSAKLVKPTGVALAEAFDGGVPGEQFMALLAADRISVVDLDALHGFCPCGIGANLTEKQVLLGLMIRGNATGDISGAVAQTGENSDQVEVRSRSLVWLQWLVREAVNEGESLDVRLFRKLAYTQCGAGKRALSTPADLVPIARQWQTYQRHECFSIAVQGLFNALLRCVDLPGLGSPFPSSAALSEWFWQQGPGSQVLPDEPLSLQQLLNQQADELPVFDDWADPGHEMVALERLVELCNGSGDAATITALSLKILAALWLRPENEADYGAVQFRPHFLESNYPINLDRFRRDLAGPIAEMPVAAALALLTKEYCLDTHQRVALRKLAAQGQDTFRFRLTETGLRLNQIPLVAETSPRFVQTMRVLQDIGALSKSDGRLEVGDVDLTQWLS
ncbi:MAG: hypothetical protein DRR42_08140 [Gammaproteobacteria bacterium]|nr:MAG: hypothetical protein DRR42_08140 [Gammaproteobacteria bacterium]